MSCCHFGQDNPARNFEEMLLFDGLSRSLQIVPLGSGRFRRVERGPDIAASCDHLEPIPAKIQAHTCQACDAGLRSQNGVDQWGCGLDNYSSTLVSSFSSLQCVECVDYEPVFGGPLQRPCIRRTRPSSTHLVVCAGSTNSWLMRGSFGYRGQAVYTGKEAGCGQSVVSVSRWASASKSL